MIVKGDLTRRIADLLALLRTTIEHRGWLNNFDLHKDAEEFFRGFFNLLYDYNLENLNHVKHNYPAIDLGDFARKLGIQITADGAGDKIRSTLETALRNNVYKDFPQIKVFIIGTKQKNYNALPSLPIVFSKDDIFDTQDVIADLEKLSTERLKLIADFVSKELKQDSPSPNSSTPLSLLRYSVEITKAPQEPQGRNALVLLNFRVNEPIHGEIMIFLDVPGTMGLQLPTRFRYTQLLPVGTHIQCAASSRKVVELLRQAAGLGGMIDTKGVKIHVAAYGGGQAWPYDWSQIKEIVMGACELENVTFQFI